MDRETQTSLDTSVQVGTDTKFIIRRKIVITRHKSTQTSLEMSTQVVSARSKMINSCTQTTLDQSVQIDTVKEREKKLFFLSRKKQFNKRCRLVEVVDKWTETSLEQSVDVYREPKQDEIFHEKIISVNNYDPLGYRGKVNDFISITPVTSIYQNKIPKIRPGWNMSESSNPFLNDTMKFYAKLTAERLNCISIVDRSSKNFYSTSFSMQPGFSFGKLPPKFPPKYEVPGPGSYDIHLMESYMRHIPGPIYIEPKPVHSPKPEVLKKDFQIPKVTKKNSSNRKSKMKNVKPATYSNKQLNKYIVKSIFANKKQFGSGFKLSRDTQTKQLKSVTTSINHSKIELDNETYNKHPKFSKQSTKQYKENDVYIKTVSKISKTFQMPLKLEVKTSNTGESISKNKSVLNVGTKSNDNLLSKKLLPGSVPSSHPFTQETELRPRPYETLDTKVVEITGSSLLKTKLENKKILATNPKTIEMKIPSISKDTTSTIEVYLKNSNKSIISGNKETDSFKAYEAKFNLASDVKVAEQTRNPLIKPKFVKSKEKLTMNNPKTFEDQIPSKSIDKISTTEVNLKNSNDIMSEIKDIDRFKAYDAKFIVALDEKVAEQTRCSLIKPKFTEKDKILTMYNRKNVEVEIPSKFIDTPTIEFKLKNSNKSIMSGNEEIDSFESYEAKFNVESDIKVFKQTRRPLIKPKSIETKKILTKNNLKTVKMNIPSKSTIEVNLKKSHNIFGSKRIESNNNYEATPSLSLKVAEQTSSSLMKPKSLNVNSNNFPYKLKSYGPIIKKKINANNSKKCKYSESKAKFDEAQLIDSNYMKHHHLQRGIGKISFFNSNDSMIGPIIKNNIKVDTSKKNKYSESKTMIDKAELINRNMKLHHLQRERGKTNVLNSNYFSDNDMNELKLKFDSINIEAQKKKYTPIYLKGNWEL